MEFTKQEILDLGDTAGFIKMVCTTTPKKHLKVIFALMGSEPYHLISDIYAEFEKDPEQPNKLALPLLRILKEEYLLIEAKIADKVAENQPLDEFKNIVIHSNRET